MIAVVQRVSAGRVDVEGDTVGRTGPGFVVLLGVALADGEAEAAWLARRVHALRVFEDAAGRMNRSLGDVGGTVLAVPQFTLVADLRRGRRPDFGTAAPPPRARHLFDRFVAELRSRGVAVETGAFGAAMQVHLVNEGPATFVLDTSALPGARPPGEAPPGGAPAGTGG